MPESPFGADVGQKPGLEIWRIEVSQFNVLFICHRCVDMALDLFYFGPQLVPQ